MLSLSELQSTFAEALSGRGATAAHAWIRANGIAADRRIGVYRNNSRIAQIDALAGIYPAVKQLVGTEFFEHMADQYRARHPSASGDLRDFGGALAEFLSTFDPVRELGYLPDVARLEWAWHECFHAAAVRPINPDELGAMIAKDAAQVTMSLIPAARLLRSPYPVADIWAFALDPESRNQTLDVDVFDPAHLLIVRPAERVEVLSLAETEFCWIEGVARGGTLAECVERALQRYPEYEPSESLASLIQLGVFTGPSSDGA